MISKDIHDILFEALYQSLITSEDLELIEKSMVQKTKEEIFEEIVGQGLLSKEQLESLESSESFILEKSATIPQEERDKCMESHEIEKIIDKIIGVVPEEEFLETFSRWNHYEISEQIGKGGSGIVYKAYDTTLDRIVAIKVMKPKEEIQERQIHRFYKEARASASLKHPNIVNIFEVNISARCPYLVMEYVHGKNLASLLREKSFAFREIAVIIKKVAYALDCAHKNGIIHRDIKPGNIMMEGNLEPKITDFGIATSIESNLSQTGEVVGTPAYMSPEQIRGKGVDVRSDVYSLGATLYEMICRITPFQGEDMRYLFYQVLEEDPVSPRKINRSTPCELEAICLKCLEKDPKKRYEGALGVAQDMENFLQNRPVLAKSPTWLTHTIKFVYRNRALVSLFSFFIILFLSGIFLYIWEINQERVNTQMAKERAEGNEKKAILAKEEAVRERQRALENEAKEKKAKKEAENRLGRAYLAEALYLREQRRWFESKLAACVAIGFEGFGENLEEYPMLLEKGTSWERTKILLNDGRKDRLLWQSPIFEHHEKEISSIAYHPSGKYFASADADGKIKIWDTRKGSLLYTLDKGQDVKSIAYDPSGKRMACVLQDNSIQIWDVENGKWIYSLQYESSENSSNIESLSYHPIQNLFALAHGNKIEIHDSINYKIIKTIENTSEKILCVAYSPDGKNLASLGSDNIIAIFETNQYESIYSSDELPQSLRYIAYSSDSNRIAGINAYEKIEFWKFLNGDLIPCDFDIDIRGVNRIAYSPDGKILACACFDKTIAFWDFKNKRMFFSPEKPSPFIALHPDGQKLAFVIEENSIHVWDMLEEKEDLLISGISGQVSCLTYSPQGERLAFVIDNKNIFVWDILQNKAIHNIACDTNKITSIAFHPGGKEIAFADGKNRVGIWITDSNKITSFHLDSNDKAYIAAYNPHGNTLAIANNGNRIQLWDIQSKKVFQTIFTNSEIVNAIAYSPHGETLAFINDGNKIQIWDLEDKKYISTLSCANKGMQSIAFTPDGKALICGADRLPIQFWDISDRLIMSFSAHSGVVNSISYHPQGKKLASAGEDGMIKIWDIGNCNPIASIQAYKKRTQSVSYSADGKILVSLGEDTSEEDDEEIAQEIKIWKENDYSLMSSFPAQFTHSWSQCYSKDRNFFARQELDKGRILVVNANNSMAIPLYIPQKNLFFLYSHDREMLVCGSDNNSLKIWKCNGADLRKASPLFSLIGHQDSIHSVQYSPDSKMLASAGSDGIIKIWDLETRFPFSDYMKVYHFEDISLSPNTNNSLFLHLSMDMQKAAPFSHLSILQSMGHREEKKQQLCLAYMRSQNWDSAFLVYLSLAAGKKKEWIKSVLLEGLSASKAKAETQKLEWLSQKCGLQIQKVIQKE